MLGERSFFGFREKLHDRRFPFAALDFDESKALRPERLGHIFQRFQLTLGEVGEALRVEGLNHAAIRDGALENLKRRVPENLREILQFQTETQVRFINAETVHRIVKRHAQERCRDVDVEHFLPNFFQHPFKEAVNIFAIDERRLDVDLSKFHLAIGA